LPCTFQLDRILSYAFGSQQIHGSCLREKTTTEACKRNSRVWESKLTIAKPFHWRSHILHSCNKSLHPSFSLIFNKYQPLQLLTFKVIEFSKLFLFLQFSFLYNTYILHLQVTKFLCPLLLRFLAFMNIVQDGGARITNGLWITQTWINEPKYMM
jgi:hypothetical protein